MFFSKFIEWENDHNEFQKFPSPWRNLRPMSSQLQFPPLPILWCHWSTLCSYSLPLLDTWHKWNRTICGHLCLSPPGPLLVSERTQEPDVTNSWGILALSPPDRRQVSAWQSISTEGQKHKSISSSMKWMVDILAAVSYGDEGKAYTASHPANMPQSSFSEVDPSLLFLLSSEIPTIPLSPQPDCSLTHELLLIHSFIVIVFLAEDRCNMYAFDARGTLATCMISARWSGPASYLMHQSMYRGSGAGEAHHPRPWKHSLGTYILLIGPAIYTNQRESWIKEMAVYKFTLSL